MTEQALALPPGLEDWRLLDVQPTTHTGDEGPRQVMFIKLGTWMPDGTVLVVEAFLHDPRELQTLAPILIATRQHSAPDIRIKVNRSRPPYLSGLNWRERLGG